MSVRSISVVAVLAAGLLAVPGAAQAATWLEPAPLDAAVVGSPVGRTSVSVAPDGRAVIGFDRIIGGSRTAMVSVRDAGRAFPPAQPLSATDGNVTSNSVDVAVDRQGNTTAVWRRALSSATTVFRIEAAYRPAGGAWSAPQVVAAASGSLPSLSVGDQGAAVVTFTVVDSPAERVYVATRGAGASTFGLASPVSPVGVAGDSIFGDPDVAMDAAGDFVLAWQRSYDEDGAGPESRDFFDEAVAKPVAGVPGVPRLLVPQTGGTSPAPPRVAIAPNGAAVVAWDYNDDVSGPAVQYASYTPGSTFASGSFGPSGNLSTPGTAAGSPRVAVDNAGGATISFGSSSGVQVASRPSAASGFSAPQAVSAPGSDVYSSVVSAAATGEVLVTWPATEGDVRKVYAARRVAGTATFGAAEVVATTTVAPGGAASFTGLSLGVDAQGDAALAYARQTVNGGVTVSQPFVAAFDAVPDAPTPPPPSGVTAPTARPPAVGAVAALRTTKATKGRTAITSLKVKGAVGGDRIVIACQGRGCTKKANVTINFTPKKGKKQLRSAVRGLVLSPEAKLSITVSRAGASSRVTTWTMVKGKAPTRQEACQDPGSTTTRTC